MIVDLWDHEESADNLQHEHREHYEAREEILAILGEARQRKDKRKR